MRMSEDKEAAGAVDTDEALARLAELEAENAALKDQVMRYAAEVDNTKRRAEREANDARAFGIQKFAKDLLAAADNLGPWTRPAPCCRAWPAGPASWSPLRATPGSSMSNSSTSRRNRSWPSWCSRTGRWKTA